MKLELCSPTELSWPGASHLKWIWFLPGGSSQKNPPVNDCSKCPVEIVDFLNKNWWIFPSFCVCYVSLPEGSKWLTTVNNPQVASLRLPPWGCLLRNELESLTDEQRFWRQVIADIQQHGETDGQEYRYVDQKYGVPLEMEKTG